MFLISWKINPLWMCSRKIMLMHPWGLPLSVIPYHQYNTVLTPWKKRLEIRAFSTLPIVQEHHINTSRTRFLSLTDVLIIVFIKMILERLCRHSCLILTCQCEWRVHEILRNIKKKNLLGNISPQIFMANLQHFISSPVVFFC